MYVVTFYSFKGGVGRSMAMMNTAFALVAEGKKVLAVDFDLEAPGLDTFNLPQITSEKQGVVDFVHDYTKTGVAPEVEKYVCSSPTKDSSDGKLWLMPAGNRNEKYADRLNSINWRKLYSEKDGYLLLEDLKAQWKNRLKPDYVLIDSRTGHTDAGGICTRQLPDAVVCLFFPNRQNLIGLTRVVNRIREESPKEKNSITLHFVTSNVPDLDDENSILEETLSDFKRKLQYSELAATIHHYPSLALLNQDIFTRDRPKSRLAAEYRQLVTAIQKENPKDRQGALMFLSDELARHGKEPFESERGKHLERISENHGKDIDVLKNLVDLKYRQGQFEETEVLLSRALDSDPKNPDLLFRKVMLSDRLGERTQAVEYALIAVQQPSLNGFELNQIVRVLATNKRETLKKIDSWPAIKNLNEHELEFLARSLSFDRALLPSAKLLIRSALAKSDKNSRIETDLVLKLETDLALNLIGQRRFGKAVDICKKLHDKYTSNQPILFNLAIATWGKTLQVPVDIFQSMLDLGITKTTNPANYPQCMSLANWATGKPAEAEKLLEESRRKATAVDFSCWSFLYRTPTIFLQELDQQKEMFSGKKVLPEVISSKGSD